MVTTKRKEFGIFETEKLSELSNNDDNEAPPIHYCHMPPMKGTTLVAFFFNGGIMIGADSRKSNEIEENKRTTPKPNLPKLPKPKPSIRDGLVKLFEVSANIVALLAGRVAECYELREHVLEKHADMVNRAGHALLVVDVCEIVSNYVYDKRGKKKQFGTIICGYDHKKGFQMFRIYLDDKDVVEGLGEGSEDYTSLGSGASHANNILVEGYKKDMPYIEALGLAQRAIFNASFYNRLTGGLLRVYTLNTENYDVEPEWEPLHAYHTFYNHYDERSTLFLIMNSDRKYCITSQRLTSYFGSSHGEEPKAAHRVAQLACGHICFYFHRIVFDSEEKATKVHRSIKKTGISHNISEPPFLKEHFPHRMMVDNVALYVSKCSKDLLEVIIKSSVNVID